LAFGASSTKERLPRSTASSWAFGRIFDWVGTDQPADRLDYFTCRPAETDGKGTKNVIAEKMKNPGASSWVLRWIGNLLYWRGHTPIQRLVYNFSKCCKFSGASSGVWTPPSNQLRTLRIQ
jgi:hypothetical protein